MDTFFFGLTFMQPFAGLIKSLVSVSLNTPEYDMIFF
jgi:hypothetical protein